MPHRPAAGRPARRDASLPADASADADDAAGLDGSRHHSSELDGDRIGRSRAMEELSSILLTFGIDRIEPGRDESDLKGSGRFIVRGGPVPTLHRRPACYTAPSTSPPVLHLTKIRCDSG